MGLEEELAMQEAIREATASMVSDLKQSLEQAVESAVREALQAELRKAISPVLASLWEELRNSQLPSVPSAGSSMPKLRRKLSNVSSIASDLPSSRRNSLQLIPPKFTTLPAQCTVRRTDSMTHEAKVDRWSSGRSEQLVDEEEALAEELEVDLETYLLPPALPTTSSRSVWSSRDQQDSDAGAESPDAESPTASIAGQCEPDDDTGRPTVGPMQSAVILPEVFEHKKQRRPAVPAWQRALRGLVRQMSCLKKPPRQTNQVRRMLVKSPNHASEIPGRPGRRSGMVLVESEVQRLWQGRSQRIWHCSWPFSDPTGRPRRYWEIFACALHVLHVLYLCFQLSFITKLDYREDYLHLKEGVSARDVSPFWERSQHLTTRVQRRDPDGPPLLVPPR